MNVNDIPGRKEERRAYLVKKRLEILDAIATKCAAFGIENYDYIIEEDLQEYLVLEGQSICCSSNSVWGVEQELLAYIFVSRNRHSLGAFEKQTVNRIKQYWVDTKHPRNPEQSIMKNVVTPETRRSNGIQTPEDHLMDPVEARKKGIAP
ncbi:MAG: hypothetical protein A2Y16_05550 [Tenericutes bacterium GWF2_57_13]|nr:MAG: hypothetical protein A2Y16_05550 [Tenericutes bacterium GWF2_57_13]